jgi:hypothetical protein
MIRPAQAIEKCWRLCRIDDPTHVSKCGDAMLPSYLFEAAGTLLTRVPKWSALKARAHATDYVEPSSLTGVRSGRGIPPRLESAHGRGSKPGARNQRGSMRPCEII